MWLLGPGVFVVVWLVAGDLRLAVAGLFGLLYLLLVRRSVVTAVSLLLVLVLFNEVLLPLSFHLGLSASIVKGLAFWKEGVLGGCLLFLCSKRPIRRMDALDVLALLFVALGTAYLLIPGLFVHGGPGAHLSLYSRAVGWRSDVLYVVFFVIFRRLGLNREIVDRIVRRVFAAITTGALIGLVEAISPSTWNRIAVNDLGVTAYRQAVVGEHPSSLFSLTNVVTYDDVHGHSIVRIGSVLYDPIAMGFVLAVGLALGAEIVVRGHAPWWVKVGTPLIAAALLLTATRSAILAGAVGCLLALRGRRGKVTSQQAVFARIIAVGILVILPLILVSGALERFTQDSYSNSLHSSRYQAAVSTMLRHPLGQGLATASGGGVTVQEQSAGSYQATVTESQLFQVGTELGFVGLAVYVGTVILLVRRLMRRDLDDPEALSPAALGAVTVGLSIGSLLQQPFVFNEVATLVWGLAGLATGVVDQSVDGPGAPGATTTMRPVATT